MLSMGAYPEVTLRAGKDPSAERQAAKAAAIGRARASAGCCRVLPCQGVYMYLLPSIGGERCLP